MVHMEKKEQENLQRNRSEEVQDILSKVPSRILLWGSGSILIILLLFIVLSIVVKFPDTVIGKVKLTTTIEPALLYNVSEGYLENIFVREDSVVLKGQVLAEIRNAIQADNIEFLDIVIAQVKQLIAGKIQKIELEDADRTFGSIQTDYNNLKKLIYELDQLNNEYFVKSIVRLKDKMVTYKGLSDVLTNRHHIGVKELENAKLQYQIDEKLYSENVISKSDWIEKTSKYHQKENELQILKESVFQNKLLIKETEGQISDLEFQYFEKREKLKNEIELVLRTIENYKSEWKQDYTIISPIDGKVKYIKKISEGEFLKREQPVALIIPQNQDIRAKADIPFQGYGKVENGQKVRITLDGFPYQEFGYLFGTIDRISDAPSDDHYEVIIEIPDDLISSYNQRMEYKPNMSGTAEIITKDYTLLERLLFSSRSVFSTLKNSK